jgi:hypothetical protein
MLTAEQILIQSELHKTQPDLFVFIKNGQELIRGSICLRSDGGEEIGRYSIEISIPREYPQKIPVVKETGNKIPKTPDRHINKKDGSACVIHEEEWFLEFGNNSSIVRFINTYVYNFFISQKYFELKKEWIYGQWAHSAEGKVEFYTNFLKIMFYDRGLLLSLAERYLLNYKLNERDFCYCKNSLIFMHCKEHFEKIQLLQKSVPVNVIAGGVAAIKEYCLRGI